jgi:hypothetical protein
MRLQKLLNCLIEKNYIQFTKTTAEMSDIMYFLLLLTKKVKKTEFFKASGHLQETSAIFDLKLSIKTFLKSIHFGNA